MSEIADVSRIVLNKNELALLKKIRKAKTLTLPKDAARVIVGKGLTTFVPPNTHESVTLMLSETGERYFTYRREHKKELWLVNFKIPVLVSIVTAIATTILLNWLIWTLLGLSRLFDGIS